MLEISGAFPVYCPIWQWVVVISCDPCCQSVCALGLWWFVLWPGVYSCALSEGAILGSASGFLSMICPKISTSMGVRCGWLASASIWCIFFSSSFSFCAWRPAGGHWRGAHYSLKQGAWVEAWAAVGFMFFFSNCFWNIGCFVVWGPSHFVFGEWWLLFSTIVWRWPLFLHVHAGSLAVLVVRDFYMFKANIPYQAYQGKTSGKIAACSWTFYNSGDDPPPPLWAAILC